MTEQRDSLEAQLDSITSQVMTVESQLIKERASTLETQVLVHALSGWPIRIILLNVSQSWRVLKIIAEIRGRKS